ncbi:MAG: sugar nucleotide-binding protein, partial [Crenarchaeota archaeon]|nr:sugar nucleotide-binding protein [Thermoproteota archaeon]
MKILVTGGTGLLGWWVADTLCAKGYNVVATFHEKQPTSTEHGTERWIKLDLEDLENLCDILSKERPDIIIHCAAYT